MIGNPDHFDLDIEEENQHDDHVDLPLEDLDDDHDDLHDDHQIIFISRFLLLHRSLSIFKHLFPENEEINQLLVNEFGDDLRTELILD